MRKIHIEDKIYEYKVGKSGVRLKCPDGENKWVSTLKIFDCTPSDLERVNWKSRYSKKWSDITPGILKNFIIEKGL